MSHRWLLFFLLAGIAFAQPADRPLFAPVGVDLDSGPLANDRSRPVTAWAETIHVPGATALQIRFDRADLAGEEAFIEVTNPLDGERMILTPEVLKQWQNHSAFFNGDTLNVRLVLGSGSTGHVEIGQVFSGIPRPGFSTPRGDSQCGGVDNRAPSSDDRVFRLMANNTTTGGGCTGWLIGNTNTFATAGHCANPFPSVLVIGEFNVPASTSGGATQHPPVADQFPVHQESVEFEDVNQGNDWAVGRLHPNSSGTSAVTRYGVGFTLAASSPTFLPPFIVPTIRITGYGADFDNLSRDFTQQTHTGPMVPSVTPNTFAYQTDTEGGNSGSPIIVESTGEVIGIHTNAGCGNAGGAATGGNTGTSIFTADVAAAVDRIRGNASLNMTRGTSYSVNSTSTIFNYPPQSGDWNVVAVTSVSDWDIESETSAGSNIRVASAAAGDSADILVANGNLGTVDPINGRIYRFAGTEGARAQGNVATTITVGTASVVNLSSTTVVQAFQFNVAAFGNFDINVTGDPSWRWRVISPGTNGDWRSWSTSVVRSGLVGGTPASSVTMNAGWYLLVVTRDGGVAAPVPTDVGVYICPTAPSIAVTTTPVAVSNACQAFTVTPVALQWYGVALASSSPWTTTIGSARSSQGGDTGIVLANGAFGTVTPTTGLFYREGAGTSATAQALRISGNIPLNSVLDDTLLAGDVGRLYQFNITVAGDYDISVMAESGSGGFFRVFAPGSNSNWIDRGDSLGIAGSVGPGFITRTLGTGQHALVVYRNAAPFAANLAIDLRVCNSAPVLALTQNAAGTTFTESCRRFTMTPVASRWNLVGVTGSGSSYDLQMGPFNSQEPLTDAEYLIGNSRNGSLTPVDGTVSRFSGTGSGVLAHATHVTVTPGSAYTAVWLPGYAFRVFEFTITTPGSYDIRMEDVGAVWNTAPGPFWRLHTDDGTADWRPRSASNFPALEVALGGTRTTNLAAGTHALTVYSNNGPETVSGSIRITIDPTPNPVPVLTGIAPSSILVGSANTVVTFTGSSFIAGSVARLNGSNLATTFVNATTLTAVVPAAQLTTLGTRDLTVFNPAPGGGSSGIQVLTVRNPVPTLASITPNAVNANGGSQVITLSGTNFNGTTVARWNGTPIGTVFVSATQLTATIPAGNLVTPGTVAAVTVFNPAPGGGASGSQSFTVRFPAPTVTAITPASRIAGQAGGFTLDVQGSGFFVGSSEILFNTTALATTFVNANLVRATVPASFVATAGPRTVSVRNPTPGGGTSNALNFSVDGPTIGSLSPNLVPIQAFGASVVITVNGTNFHAGSVVHANSDPLPTVFISSTQLSATISSLTQPALRVNSGLVLSVRNSALTFSNFSILQVGGSNNRGVVARGPVAPAPGEAYSVELYNGTPGSLFTLIVDFAPVTVTSIFPFIDPAANYSLNVRPFNPGTGDWFALLDGFGLHGPATPGAAYNSFGRFSLPGFTVPNPALGIDLSVQGIFLDPSVPVGYRLTWVRHADRL